jgi:hypothetical protein
MPTRRHITRPRVIVPEHEGEEGEVVEERVRTGPRVFDWCEPWRTPAQHAKCRGSYPKPFHKGITVVCECPTCNHAANPNPTLF